MTVWTGSPDRELDREQRIAADLLVENLYLCEQMAAALAVVEQDVPEACYRAESMEYYDEPCLRCALRELLTVSDPLTLDLLAARSTQPNGAAA